MSSEEELPQKKKQKNLPWLPDYIPSLQISSRSDIASKPENPLPTWFTLWIKADQIDKKKKKNKFSRSTRLVQISSSYYYYPFDPVFILMQCSVPVIWIGNYGGKLLILWDKFVHPGQFQEKNIWCAVVALERRNETAASAATTSIAEPPSKKRKTNPSPPLPPPSFLSLPDVLILNCLSRIPKSYYPKLSIVSKTFRDLILSIDLNHARFHHKTQETFFHVCLKFPDRPLPSWYTLWIKPEGFDDKEEEKKKSTLVQVPSSYASHNPLLVVSVDSDVYAFKQCYPPSRVMYVRNKEVVLWRNAPNMTVARANPVAYVFDKKIYVMGGCAENESANWGEVFDPKTQTWESLPVPAPELRFSSMIRKLEMIQGKFYVRSNESKDSVYDPKNGKWNVAAKPLVSDSRCAVGDVWYSFRPNSCLWFDNEIQDWRLVKGLSSLNQSCRSGLIETVSYDGKLLLLWDKPTKPRRRVCGEKYICCALIAFEKRKNGQVWAMDSEVEPSQKKKKPNSSPSFVSLPDVILVNCLARIPKSYYPKLSLVCKSFCSLILSMELYVERLYLRRHEDVFHVCLQLPDRRLPSWFSLWTKPDQTLTNDIGKKKKSTRNTLLVPIPSSYSPRVPMFIGEIGSELYAISKHNSPSSVMWVRNKSTNYAWRKAPSMTVARANVFACVINGKIYVMGGCAADESTNWAEVFDPKTQTWEPLPDPGDELRLSSFKTMEVIEGKIYVKKSYTMDYVYDPEEDKWDVITRAFMIERKCEIENVLYRCRGQSCSWYDTKQKEWRDIKGLATLNRYRRSYVIEVANYCDKLLILWEIFAKQNKNIWCAVISLKRRKDDEIWGKVEWASIVLTVPSSYVFLRCEVKPV
ncbi:hypothetical protein ARALYDRAFT_327926 [Arabidopsis lyrata subsp. lyrata]|uniref:F-box domain-containing protein n=2 Tax=Arabidopsis lyrata subsp. lyrata TaxID=81972 RepID=D7M951_ARALL|nr:hypothetical protein ARALYDRAFT_327926 [Arabidopsis lyrata subsp. lyrata]